MGARVPCLKIRKIDGAIVERYCSAAKLCMEEPVCVPTLLKKRISPGPYIYRYERDYQPKESLMMDVNRGAAVMCFDYQDKVAHYFDSTKEASAWFGYGHKTNSVSDACKHGRYLHGCKLKYPKYIGQYADLAKENEKRNLGWTFEGLRMNYPQTTWNGDRLAPWNQEEEQHECRSCSFFRTIGELTVCTRELVINEGELVRVMPYEGACEWYEG